MVATDQMVTPERYASGLTFDEFMQQIRVNREGFQNHYDWVSLTDDDRRFFTEVAERAGGEVHVMALAEDW
jgi:hypothetical protein